MLRITPSPNLGEGKGEVKQTAFTLAEILIALGIIGVVAVLTLPSLIQNHNNRVVEAKLKKIYSTMNQAIVLAEIDYGDRVEWYNYPDLNFDKNGNPVKGSSGLEKWVNKYIAPYLKTNKVSVGTDESGRPAIYFQDGSILSISNTHKADWVFWTNHKGWGCGHNGSAAGRCVFYFNYCPDCAWFGDSLKYIRRNFEPYKFGWDGSYEQLKENCKSNNRTYCTALIQYNGWKIPKDYPHKVRY